MIPTGIPNREVPTGLHTAYVPMPICRYEILDGPDIARYPGAPVTLAVTGDTVYHKWTCDSETCKLF